MADIFETCELINQYIEESKGNVIDKVYGKDIEKALKYNKLSDIVKNSESPQKIIDEVNSKKDLANRNLSNKLARRMGRNEAFYDQRPYKDRNKNMIASAVLGRENRSKKGDDYNFDLGYSTSMRRGIQSLKHGLGAGKDNIPKDREPGTYLKMQKALKESVDARLNVYEAYESGVITEFEKDELLNILNTYEE